VTEDTKQRIDRHMTIQSILDLFPHKAQRLSQEINNAGLHCVGCHAATWETLEGGMNGHGMGDAEIDRLVDRLNMLLEHEADATTITLTPKAAKKYLVVLEEEEKQGWGIRFSEKKSGCTGFQFVLDYSEKASPEDRIFVSHGIEIHVGPDMVDKLIGSEIDYIDGLQGSGFKVSNPNVSKSCGCGSSHGY